MNDLYFPALILLPSAGICYLSLSTFYGWRHAYEAISWVPLVPYLSISAFNPVREFAPATGPDLATFLHAIALLSLVQGLFGIGLTVRALIQHKPSALLLLTSFLAALPFAIEFV
jgi:hypothetical protein